MSALDTPAPCSAPSAKRTLQRLARTRLGFRALSSVVRADPQVMVEALDLHVKATAGGKSDDAAELEDLSSAHGRSCA